MIIKRFLSIWALCAVLLAIVSCGSIGRAVSTMPLDQAILEAAKKIEDNFETGTKIALLNFYSPSNDFSNYVLNEISGYLVNSGKFMVVERRELDLIRQEEKFQLSGEVSDESAQSIGKKYAAQIIVSGSLTSTGNNYRFMIKTNNVETAVITTTTLVNLNPKDKNVVSVLAGTKPPVEEIETPVVTRSTIPKSTTVVDKIKIDYPLNHPNLEWLVWEIIDGKTITIIKFIENKNNPQKNVQIPHSINKLPVTVIKERAFENCSKLINITIPSSITSIGNSAFYGCYNLKNIIIPSSVISIGESAFYGCEKLERLINLSSITIIEPHTFYNCHNLRDINIPLTVTSIGNESFSSCTSLTNIFIPSSITSISYGEFAHCSKLMNINVDPYNMVYRGVGGVLFDKNAQTLVRYPEGKKGEYSIPTTVTFIGNSAFYGCRYLEDITIPSTVTSIGDSAFRDCYGLTRIKIPSSVKTIGRYAFSGCFYLKSITIPSTVTSIGDSAFASCSDLKNVTLSRSTKVGKGAFGFVQIHYREDD